MSTSKLSADPTALVLGIVALVLGFASCCCYGIIAIIPLIVAIIGLVSANKSIREYNQHPEVYSAQSRSNVSTGKILNIIAIVFNGIIVLFFLGALIFYGSMLSSGALNEFLDIEDFKNEKIYVEEEATDSLYIESETYENEAVLDTIKMIRL